MPLTESKIEAPEPRESRYNVTDSGGLILEILLIADVQMRYRRWEAHPRGPRILTIVIRPIHSDFY